MVHVHFDKRYVEAVIAAVNAGRPIDPPESGWDLKALMQVAAVARYATADKAHDGEFYVSLTHLCDLLQQVLHDRYDTAFGPSVDSTVEVDGAEVRVTILRGKRGMPVIHSGHN